MKNLLIFIVLLISGVFTKAQKVLIHGYLKDSLTETPIGKGKITNVTAKRSVTTDPNGFFKIEATPDDFIFVTALGYRYDTLNYSILYVDTITLYLAHVGNVLPNVIVTSRYTRYQLDSLQRRTEFEQDRGTVHNTVEGNRGPGFGMVINLDRFKKKYRNKKSEEKVFNELERNAYVAYRFSPQLVALYTGLKGEALQNFILKHSPGYEWLRQHRTNEDVLYYINDVLKRSK